MSAQAIDDRLAAAWAALTPAQRVAAVVRMEGALRPIPGAWEGAAPDEVPRPPVVVVRGGYRPRRALDGSTGELQSAGAYRATRSQDRGSGGDHDPAG